MQQKMTITIDREVYDALYRVVGKGNISKFLENLARPHVLKEDLASAYQAMAADTERESEALEWSNGLMLGETHAEEAAPFGKASPTARFYPLGSVNDAQR
jgi:predicted CopG family antitoxin